MHCCTKLSQHKTMKLSVWRSGLFFFKTFVYAAWFWKYEEALSICHVRWWSLSLVLQLFVIPRSLLINHLFYLIWLCTAICEWYSVAQRKSLSPSLFYSFYSRWLQIITRLCSLMRQSWWHDICCHIKEGKTQDCVSKQLFLRKKANASHWII